MDFIFDYNPFEQETSPAERLEGLISFVLLNFDTEDGNLLPFTEYLYHLHEVATQNESGCDGVHIMRRMDMVEEWEIWFENAFDRGWMW